MNNIEKFRKLFLEFEVATRKKVGNDRLNLDECIKELKSKRINPYIRDDNFIDFCRRLRNINSHNINDNYYLITDETITKLEKIVEEVKQEIVLVDGIVSNCELLNIRKESSKDAEVLCTIGVNTMVKVDLTVDKEAEEFYKIVTPNGVEGYCMKKFITIN